MGSVSSVYVLPSERSISEADDEFRTHCENNREVEAIQEERRNSLLSMLPRNTMEIRLSPSFNAEIKDIQEGEMGLTIQHLAAENARLALVNKELCKKLETVSVDQSKEQACYVEIFEETVEQRLIRLEKTLNSERKEKWKAIEEGEKIRVDLVNCERELALKSEEIKIIQNELSECQKMTSSMKEIIERLQNRDGIENTPEPHKILRDSGDMADFKADLLAKREIRQNVLAAKSAEMQKLREELEKERWLRVNLQRQIEPTEKMVVPTAGSEREKALRFENDKLRDEVQTLSDEVRSLNSTVNRLKCDFNEEKALHEKTTKEKTAIQTEKEELAQILKEMELEKERMWADYDREKLEVNKRTTALKDVVEISRQMLLIRESQVKELKKKLQEIEESVNNSKLPDQKNLREEYEKQLQNIKTLKELYEERVHLMELERDKLNETISQHIMTIEGQKGEIESLKEQCGNTSEELKKEKYQNDSLERDLRLSIAKSKDFENELSLINNLFTQMLLGPYNTGNETDLDKLTELLQENHDLITELTLRENSSEIASALPKLLLDLITQVDGNGQLIQEQVKEDLSETDTASEQSDSFVEGAVLPILSYKKAILFENPVEMKESNEESETVAERMKMNDNVNPTVQEIASNLPKVWRVLMELLSHHTAPDGPPPGDEKQCYKNIETPSGTRSVISVSNTFIRLKDLILEKKALQKELVRLKQLNSHLENRLDDQEKRLSHVQCELHKTWGIVGRMRAQHQQLHNHERILRYELQEKRVMLSELKQELEYCRDKWERARQKNNESETQWQKLRREFAARKNKGHLQHCLNDSGESGFSDEPNESGEEGENFDADRSSTQSPVDGKSVRLREQSSEKIVEDTEEGTSSGVVPRVQPSDEERLRLREARLKRLEDQCELLVRKVDITTSKSNYLNNRLEELHEQYGAEASGHDIKTEEEKNLVAPKDDSFGSSVSDQTEEAVACSNEPQIKPNASKRGRTVEEILNARSERLRRLEEQCQSLVGKVTNSIQRGSDLSNKLEDLHAEYLNSETASSERHEIRNHLTRTEGEESTDIGVGATDVIQQEDKSAEEHGNEK